MKSNLGKTKEALAMLREVYAQESSLLGKGNEQTIQTAIGLGEQLIDNQDFAEARSLLREAMDTSRASLGPDAHLTFMLYAMYSQAIVKSLYANQCADARGVLDAEETLEENAERARRVLGPKHPVAAHMLRDLTLLRKLVRGQLKDPEIQAILRDPRVRQVIQDLSGGDVAAGQRAMSDPVMRGKIEKLIASGVLQKNGDRISGVKIEALKRP